MIVAWGSVSCFPLVPAVRRNALLETAIAAEIVTTSDLPTTDRRNKRHFVTILQNAIGFNELQVNAKAGDVAPLLELWMFADQVIQDGADGSIGGKVQA